MLSLDKKSKLILISVGCPIHNLENHLDLRWRFSNSNLDEAEKSNK